MQQVEKPVRYVEYRDRIVEVTPPPPDPAQAAAIVLTSPRACRAGARQPHRRRNPGHLASRRAPRHRARRSAPADRTSGRPAADLTTAAPRPAALRAAHRRAARARVPPAAPIAATRPRRHEAADVKPSTTRALARADAWVRFSRSWIGGLVEAAMRATARSWTGSPLRPSHPSGVLSAKVVRPSGNPQFAYARSSESC